MEDLSGLLIDFLIQSHHLAKIRKQKLRKQESITNIPHPCAYPPFLPRASEQLLWEEYIVYNCVMYCIVLCLSAGIYRVQES
jgi:hypothetical protein